ncbi:endoglycosylceramidase [Nocardiopsis mwathae]|uniref:Endoglycosylceramidase n=1 Tax=Nocardiopsis mwathae TaxID=1472723 RepID=A0A7W9YLG8_9ACTN|nr:cellulase family glycosylhydrolase [Nocardiopsis mwathae]MBB6174368.1 endoglycosylceramidase [Nocardiopsis mwathae]
MKRLPWLAAVVTLVLVGGVLAAIARPSPENPRFITDDQGRALILHGFNTSGSTKRDPDSMPWIEEQDVENEYRLMGTNFVRFLLQWSALEPAPDEYDEDYLDAVAERVSWYADRDFHVLLDMHQDLWGQSITAEGNVGNGAPPWATHTDGLPVAEQEQWELVYLEPGTMRSFDHFWNTTGEHPELMDHYVRAWGHVAERFADEPSVIGYDLMNEPWGGTLQGPAFERGPLAELYRRCIDAIRGADEDSWIFVEPQAVGTNWGLPSALPHLADPRYGEPRIVYAPHIYPLPMDLGESYGDDTSRAWIDRSVDLWRTNVQATAERLEAPVVLGEFGLDTTSPGAMEYVERLLEVSDEMGAGRAYWSNDLDGWGPWDYGNGGEDISPGALVEVMNRPYPRAIAGEPLAVRYDHDTLTLTVSFAEKSDEDVTGPTEIYVPEDRYPGGGTISSSDPEGAWTAEWDAERSVWEVESDPRRQEHELVITPPS